MLLVTRSSSAQPATTATAMSSGQARVFTLTDGVWVQVGADIDGENANDWSG